MPDKRLCICQVLLQGVLVVVLGVAVHAHLAHIRAEPCLHHEAHQILFNIVPAALENLHISLRAHWQPFT